MNELQKWNGNQELQLPSEMRGPLISISQCEREIMNH